MSGFEEIVGHRDVVEHLKLAIATDAVSHAYILDGEKGSGKKAIARTFARALNCEGTGEGPCEKCHSCLQALHKNHPDIVEVTHEKPDSLTVDDIRKQVVDDVQIRPYSSRYKVYIVPDAEKMTKQAQNALLKTIEEPPDYAVILLLTANLSVLLQTILSRCVVLHTKPIPDEQVRNYLMEHEQMTDYEADLCVAFAQGNIGKALRLAQSESLFSIKESAVRLLQNIQNMDMTEIIQAIKGVSEYKFDVSDYLDFLAMWYRDVLYFKATSDVNGIIFRDKLREIQQQATQISYEGVEAILEGIQKAKERLAANVNFELTLELLFLLMKEKGER